AVVTPVRQPTRPRRALAHHFRAFRLERPSLAAVEVWAGERLLQIADAAIGIERQHVVGSLGRPPVPPALEEIGLPWAGHAAGEITRLHALVRDTEGFGVRLGVAQQPAGLDARIE